MKQLLHQLSRWRKPLQRLFVSIAFMAIASGAIVPPAGATGVYDLPYLSAGDPTWVVDEGEVFSRVSQGSIRQTLEQIHEQTGNEVRFVTIRHLDYGETIESFTNALFEKWFPTPEAQANQVVLALDTVTNNAAIRVGEEAKATLTDEIAQSVANETLMVPIRQGDKYNQGFLDASDRLIAVLSGQPDPGPPVVKDTIRAERTFATAEETEATKGSSTILVVVLLIGATVIPMVTYFVLYN